MTARVLSPRLPLTTRARLYAERRVDGMAAQLVEHGHIRAAEWLWRACRML
ncbi:MAG: hypothetical protein HOV82_16755 [Streptomyces sp.]|nr:hypothetical protein [Streptomyces sp.]NUP36175.1 hypothetical protein [Streptomyces sp.]NUS75522.1 hypothetical protein [Streptomyces sp.]